MTYVVSIHDKETGKQVDKIEVEVRDHVTNYQAMISWKGITKIAYGNGMKALPFITAKPSEFGLFWSALMV